MSPLRKGKGGEGAPKKKRRSRQRVPNWLIAVIFILVFTIGPYLAFTKHVPFTSYGYEVKATFTNSANIALKSPVRIAGVEVGKVIKTERDGDATTVTFTVDGTGRPIHENAFASIRPRIFLEGNFFVELDPGSPGSPELASGGTIPISHTSTAVQIDEVLTALQSPVRADLGRLLESYGTALTNEPTAAEDLTQLPQVQGISGGEALNKTFQYGGEAGKYSSQVTQALTGTQKGDLAKLVAGTGRTASAFASNQADLEGLIENFNIFTGALANQSENLSTTVSLLAPTLQTAHTSLVSLDRSLPPLRTYAIELTPAVAELPGLISASKPWLAQVRPLLSEKEAGGTARLLAEATPGLAGAAQAGKQLALPQLNQLSLCTTQGPGADRQRDDQRPVQHRRPELPRVPLRPDELRRRGRRTSTATGRSCGPTSAAARSWSAKQTRRATWKATRSTTPTSTKTRSARSRSWAASRNSNRKFAATPTRCPTSTAASGNVGPASPSTSGVVH